jgi:hopanoid biosynthesis associated protein HpnK
VTADDFGQSREVNRAVVQANRSGILTCASLMVSAPCAKDAVALAHKHPRLRVGLHLVLVDGSSVLTPQEIPRLVDRDRRFAGRPAAAGLAYRPSAETRRQLSAECEAQMKAFLQTGLRPDHLNSHHHLHIHPVIAGIVVALARKYDIPAVRLPLQSAGMLKPRNLPLAAAMLPWTLWLRKRLRRSGVASNQSLLGLYETGCMHEDNWMKLIPAVEPGVSEIFCHPAAPAGEIRDRRSARQCAEFQALTSGKVIEKLRRENIVLTTFSEIRRKARWTHSGLAVRA